MNCPNCNEQLSERGFFCQTCAIQVRCIKCKEPLEPAAKACVECGMKIGGAISTPENGTASFLTNRNTLTYREDRNSRAFDASLTDAAIEHLGGVFGDLFLQRGATRTGIQTRTMSSPDAVPEQTSLPLPESTALNIKQPVAPATPTPATLPVDKERMLKIFAENGEKLELRDIRLKAKNGAEYHRRLTYLFLYAHELLGRSTTPRSELTTIFNEAKVMNSNSRTWLGKRVGFTVDPDGRTKLREGAREEAVKFLDEIGDPNIEDEWNPDTRAVKTRSKKANA